MRTWLITGCSSGIGRGTAEAVLRRGDRAVITARNTADIRFLAEKYPGTALALALDVTDNDSIDSAVKISLERFGKIDVLMNNAGFGYRSAVEEGDMKIIGSLFQTHLFGPFELIRKILPGMKSRGHGVIINVSSIGGIRSAPNNGWYSASKGALELMSYALRIELKDSGVKVLVVELGAFRTKFYESIAGKSAANETGQPGYPHRAGEIIAGIIERPDCPGIYTYHGVQYATAEPFIPPVKVSSWDGVKLTLNYGPMSPQSIKPEDDMFPVHYYWPLWEGRNYPQDNSCQNLNIWTPGLDNAKRPVMIWLHGGGFEAGSSLAEDVFRGENLARKGDVVVVSLNHRLNVLGFLDLSAYGEKYKYSGNLGMMDIVAALEWVRDNISHFGGDPSNVTLFGQSGGGAKILTLMAMPSAKGLFHKVIEQSGAVQIMGITLPDQKISRRVAELVLADLGIDPANVDSLKDVPFERLDMAGKKALAEVKISWAPVKDGEIIPKAPVKGSFSRRTHGKRPGTLSMLTHGCGSELLRLSAPKQSSPRPFTHTYSRERLPLWAAMLWLITARSFRLSSTI